MLPGTMAAAMEGTSGINVLTHDHSERFVVIFFYHFDVPAQLVGGFALSDLDKS